MNQHRVAIGAALFCVLVMPCPSLHAQQSPAQTVSTVSAAHQAIADNIEFVGRVEAPEKVDIRAQVKGILQDVLFKDGEDADAGKPLGAERVKAAIQFVASKSVALA